MEYARLGPRGCLISQIGFGCAPVSGYDYGVVDESAWKETVRASLDHGIDFFDVADVYGFGRAEELLSHALGEQRHKVKLATKFGLAWDGQGRTRRDSSPKHIEKALNDSLRRLRVDSITLYQLHWTDGTTPLQDILDLLLSYRDEGRIQFIGVSNVALDELQRSCPAHAIDSVQVAYNLLCRAVENGLLGWCGSTRTSVLAHSGLARGLLSGRRPPGASFDGPDTRNRSGYFSREGSEDKQRLVDALRQIGKRNGCSPSAVALRWILDQPRITSVLVGMKNPSQLEDNLQAIGWRLDSDDREFLSSLSGACPGALDGALATGALHP
jgi:myo-inositol catabolism protein IolS